MSLSAHSCLNKYLAKPMFREWSGPRSFILAQIDDGLFNQSLLVFIFTTMTAIQCLSFNFYIPDLSDIPKQLLVCPSSLRLMETVSIKSSSYFSQEQLSGTSCSTNPSQQNQPSTLQQKVRRAQTFHSRGLSPRHLDVTLTGSY